MRTPFLLSLLTLIILSSCNNAAKQQAREKFVADSVATAINNQQQQKEALLQVKADLQKSIQDLQQRQDQLKQDWAQTEAKLTAANDNLRSVSEFHLLRSSSERQAEIQAASLKVNELTLTVSNIKQQYSDAQNNLVVAQNKLAAMQ